MQLDQNNAHLLTTGSIVQLYWGMILTFFVKVCVWMLRFKRKTKQLINNKYFTPQLFQHYYQHEMESTFFKNVILYTQLVAYDIPKHFCS